MDDADSVDVVRIVRQRSEHNISRRQIDPDALKVLYRLMRGGYTAYLVGGGVRDLLLGVEPKDFDVATDAHPREIRRLFRNSFLIGRRFRLVHVRFGENVIETSTFRRRPELLTHAAVPVAPGDDDDDARLPDDESTGARYHESDNTFGTAEEDAWRRDFTINALFYDIRTFAIIDHVGGLQDLDQRLIRSIGDPNVRFLEDPVRMLRAVRFAARLKFRIEEDSFAAIVRHAAQMNLAAPARMLEEIYKLFPYAAGEPAFRLLHETGLLDVMFPELQAFINRGAPETAWFWGHLKALGQLCPNGADPALLFGVLLLAVFQEQVREARLLKDFARQTAVARALLEPIATRYRMPKRVFYRALLLLDAQRRLAGDPERMRARFFSNEAFDDMLTLRAIHLMALGEETSPLEAWEARRAAFDREGNGRQPDRRRRSASRDSDTPVTVSDELPSGDETPETTAPVASDTEGDSAPRRRRRPRRRGGRGRDRGDASASSDAVSKGGQS